MGTDSHRGLMGQYAGIVTRGVALIIDILIVIVAALVINASISLPLDFFLGINKQSCTAGVTVGANWDFLRSMLCQIYDWIVVAVAVLTGPIYFIFLSTAGGQTIGKYVMGVRIVRVDGKQMSYIKAFLRYAGYFVSLATLGIGFIWVVFDSQRRALHDHLAGTCVIYSWRAQQNALMLSRIQRFFGRRQKAVDRQAMLDALSTHKNDLVTLSVPGYDNLRALLRIVQNGRQNGLYNILGMLEYAKDATGQMSRVDDIELAADAANTQRLVDDAGFSRDRIEQIRAGIPNDHFALAIIARDDEIDALVKLVSQRTAAVVRRYDLGAQAPVPAAPARATAVLVQSAPAATLPPVSTQTAAPAVIAPPAASAPASPAAAPSAPAGGSGPAPVPATPAPASGSSAFNAQPIRVPEEPDVPAAPEPAAANGASTADLLREIKQLQAEQATLQEQLQTRGGELAALETRFRDADSQLAGLRTAYDAQSAETAKLRNLYDAGVAAQVRTPAIADLERRLSALPPAKLAAANAAVAAGVLPRFVDTPQDLADIKGIGTTYEQRLYRAGIGAFWEVACLADDDLRTTLEVTELQATQVDLPEIRTDARRLADESGSVGQIWDGQPPDDFEPIDGIGKVFEQRLYTAGIRTYRALAGTSPEQLAAIVKAQKPLQPDYQSWIAQARALTEKP
ncbi:MAG: RDD family protein [Caldilineaceae bacterium]|nr:RDD family protein [Caldilineaceae bacterium]